MAAEAEPRRVPEPGELLAGDDHEFIVNLYLALLQRWPDEAGYGHFLEMVAGRPERRLDAVREVAGSEEARRAGTASEIGPDPVPPLPSRSALAVSLDLRTAPQRDEVAKLRTAVELLGGAGGPELAGLAAELIEARDAALRSEIGGLRQEVAAALGAVRTLRERPDGASPEPPAAAADPLPARLADYVADLLAITEARFEARLRALEARSMAATLPPEPDRG